MNGDAPPRRTVRTALVTGAAGFVGACLARRLRADGVTVRALVRDPAKAPRLEGSGAQLVRGDLLEPATLEAAVAGADTVFHCAALVTGDARPPAEFEAVNVKGARDLFEACLRAGGVERVVHVSTVGIYGHTKRGTVTAEDHPPRPESLYGITKLASEKAALEAHSRGLPVVIARPMWVYGAGSPGVERLFELVARGKMVTLGGGRNAIQPIDVQDLAEGLLACATAVGVEGEAFHLAGPRAITTADFCAEIAAAQGVPPPARDIPLPVAQALAWGCEHFYPAFLGKPPLNREKVGIFVNEHAYAIDKAAARLGWRPRVAFADGARLVAKALRGTGGAT